MSQDHIENIENISKSDSNFAPKIVDCWSSFITRHNVWHCLIKDNISIPKKVINLYISYRPNTQWRNLKADFRLGNCLFWSIKLTKNANQGKYKYSGYGIGFDSCSEFLFTDGSFEKNYFWSWYELICAYW